MQDNYSLEGGSKLSDILGTSKVANGDNEKPSPSEKNDTNDGPGKTFPGFSESFGVITGSDDANTRKDDHEKGGESNEGGDGFEDIFENAEDTLESGNIAVWSTKTFGSPVRVGGVDGGNKVVHEVDYTKKAVEKTALFY